MTSLCRVGLACGLAVLTFAQSAPPDRAAAYYHAALGHLYEDLAGQYGGNSEYVRKAIDNYKLALKADPSSGFLAEQLADLYIGANQMRSAVNEFEEALKRNADDLNARRILARLYMFQLREGRQGRPNMEMLNRAIEQYEQIGQRAPKDVATWAALGRLYKLANRSADAEKAYTKALDLDANNEEAMSGLAMVYSDLGENAKATLLLKRLAEKNPNLRTLTMLAATYEQMKDYKGAAEAYRRALEASPGNADLKRAYAQSLFQAEDFGTAQKVFEELLAEDSNDLLSNLQMSRLMRQKQEFAKAKQYAAKARELDGSNLEVRYNEVQILEAEGKIEESITLLREIIAGLNRGSTGEKSNRTLLLERLGFLHRQAGQVDKAVETFKEIAQAEPDLATRAMAQVVEAYRGGKRFKDAEREAQELVAKQPNDRLAKLMLSNVQADLGQYDKAAATMRGLLDGKSDRETYLSLAQIYEKGKNYGEMAKAIDQAEKLSANDDERENAWFMRGAMLEKMKKFDESEAEFRRVLKHDPDSAAALNYLGYMLADRNVRVQEALEMIKKAVDQDPTNGAYLDSLGWAYFRLGKMDEAEDYLKKAMMRTPNDPAIHDHLADVYAARGRWREAIAQWETSLKEWNANAAGDVDPAEVAKVQKKLEAAKIRLAKETGARK